MNKKDLKFIFAPLGVATGMTVFISLCILLTRRLGITGLKESFHFIPDPLFFIAGLLLTAVFFPVFISSIIFLSRRGAVGQAIKLRTWGIYKYVRNPMYSGASFTITGTGLMLNNTGVVLAGLLWLAMTCIQCKREEKELLLRFGKEYERYRRTTAMYIPDFRSLAGDILKRRRSRKA